MKDLLVISHRSPEESGGRPAKLRVRSELLSERGWETHIVVVEDTVLGIVVGVVEVLRELRRRDPDVYLSMSNPPHLHLIGLLVSFFTSTPWLAEFRDPLVTIPEVDSNSLSGRFRKLLEAAVLRRSNQSVWPDGIQMEDKYFDRAYGEWMEASWYKLPYLGYHASKFEGVESVQFDRFTVTYAGSFYEGWVEPYSFLDGFREFVDRRGFSADDVQFLVYGEWDESYERTVQELELSEYVRTYDFIPHEELIPILAGSDVTLYIGGQDQRNRLSVPSKIWDYLGVQTPILVVIDPTFRASEFVQEKGIGLVADAADHNAIADMLELLYDGEFEYRGDDTGEFRRARHVDELVTILESVVEGEPKHGLWHT